MDVGNDIREAVIKYSDMLYKICIVILCNEQDVQDGIQGPESEGLYWRGGKYSCSAGT